MKTCPKCKEEKPFSEFHKNRAKKDGYQNQCKVCRKAINKLTYDKYGEKNRERARKYAKENKERRKEYARKYTQENREKIKEYRKKCYLKNKEKILEYHREWREENKDYLKEYQLSYRSKNRQRLSDYHKEYQREYRKKQPAGIYTITNTANGKMYVGETGRLPKRFWEHINLLKKGKHDSIRLQTDYDQHSLDVFDFQVIEEHPPDADKKLLLERERYFINKYKEEGKELYNVV